MLQSDQKAAKQPWKYARESEIHQISSKTNSNFHLAQTFLSRLRPPTTQERHSGCRNFEGDWAHHSAHIPEHKASPRYPRRRSWLVEVEKAELLEG